MTLSVVINTVAIGPFSGIKSSAGLPYSDRVEWITDIIVPCCQHEFVDEVIVVGDFKEGTGYRYVPCPSGNRFSLDIALRQRQAGADASKSNRILFLMDDFVPEPDLLGLLPFANDNEIVSPECLGITNGKVELLNNGVRDPRFSEPTYVHTHGISLSRKAIDACPWSKLTPIIWYDVIHSMWLCESGFTMTMLTQGVYNIESHDLPWFAPKKAAENNK